MRTAPRSRARWCSFQPPSRHQDHLCFPSVATEVRMRTLFKHGETEQRRYRRDSFCCLSVGAPAAGRRLARQRRHRQAVSDARAACRCRFWRAIPRDARPQRTTTFKALRPSVLSVSPFLRASVPLCSTSVGDGMSNATRYRVTVLNGFGISVRSQLCSGRLTRRRMKSKSGVSSVFPLWPFLRDRVPVALWPCGP
jgi:hypothetical protein